MGFGITNFVGWFMVALICGVVGFLTYDRIQQYQYYKKKKNDEDKFIDEYYKKNIKKIKKKRSR